MDKVLLSGIQDQLREQTGKKAKLNLLNSVGGGSINETYRVAFEGEDLFLKVNRSGNLPALFERECDGLRKLHRDSKVNTPCIRLQGSIENTDFLLMEWVHSESPTEVYWERLALGLAEIHRQKGVSFGLEHDNYIGSLPQRNQQLDNWGTFWAEERIMPQLDLCRGALSSSLTKSLEQCSAKANELFPQESPALLHGDLWSGNVMTGPSQSAWFIDPAVYYGHREMDLGMTKLFGGFADTFYEVYQHTYPMETGWEERMSLAMLYPLLVHVNLFGLSYASQIEQIMKKWGF